MSFLHSIKKPLILTGKEIAFASGSYYTSTKIMSYAYTKIEPYFSDEESRFKFVTSLDAMENFLSVGLYSALSIAITQYPRSKSRFQWCPSISRHPPIPIPHAMAAGLLVFAFSPVAKVLIYNVSEPVIELYHSNNNNNASVNSRDNECKPNIKADDGGLSVKESTPSTHYLATSTQVSIGTNMAPIVEAAVPGSVTIMAPLSEEIFFRGLLFGRLIPSIGCLPAALTSSVIFASLHTGSNGSKYLPISEAIIGMTSCLLYHRTGRLLVPVLFHAGCNSWAVLVSAFQSCQQIAGVQWFCAKSDIPGRPEFSFWERRAAEIFPALLSVLSLLGKYVCDDEYFSDEGAPFLPLDFFGASEEASSNSIFFDSQTDGLRKAPVLCNTDGSLTKFAQCMIEAQLDALFGNEESISVDEMIGYIKEETKLRLAFHILATMPERAKASSALMNAPIGSIDIYKKTYALLEDEKQKHVYRELTENIGFLILLFPSGSITRSKFKESYTDCLRLGLHSEMNQNLFIFYFIARGSLSNNIDISELLKEYCDIEKRLMEGQK